MQQRAINVILTGVTASALAGMLVAGVSVASDDSAPSAKKFLLQEAVASQQHNHHDRHPAGTTVPGASKLAAKGESGSAGKGESAPAAKGKAKPGRGADSRGDSAPAAKRAKKGPKALLSGRTTASYFWDDGSGVRGDTGAPASGKPMQKGMFASPSWPMLTKVKVSYKGRSIIGFVGDRGPGRPSHQGIMLDLDTYTFRYLLDGGKPASKYNAGTGQGHLKGIKWEVLSWGPGAGKKGPPKPFGS